MVPLSLDVWSTGRIGVIGAAPVRGLNVSGQYYYVGLAILGVLMLVALIKAYQMWEEIHEVEEPDSPTDLLKSFEDARTAGELDDEEFERVRQRLAAMPSEKDGPSGSSSPLGGPPDLA